MPTTGSKGAPKNHGELKDDTSSSREEKKGWGGFVGGSSLSPNGDSRGLSVDSVLNCYDELAWHFNCWCPQELPSFEDLM
ncbi:hypothetical protein AAG906_010198 [Vitis piasezkii]